MLLFTISARLAKEPIDAWPDPATAARASWQPATAYEAIGALRHNHHQHDDAAEPRDEFIVRQSLRSRLTQACPCGSSQPGPVAGARAAALSRFVKPVTPA